MTSKQFGDDSFRDVQKSRPDPLITVASSGNVMMTNAAVSPSGTLFGNFPRWTDVPTPSVGEATAGGGFEPFPGGEWNAWRSGLPPHERFVCTHGLHADRDDNLWAIDDASCPTS